MIPSDLKSLACPAPNRGRDILVHPRDMKMNARIGELLTSLYGTPAAAGRAEEIASKLAAYSTRINPPQDKPLDQTDVLLITYADQVQEPGVPPLQTLSEFLSARATGLVSAVHLLPFYPYSSDDGFAVIDYYQVAPELGTWQDVASIGSRFDLMFDAVLNHVSSKNAWFQAYLRRDPAYREWFISVPGDPDLSRVVRPRALPLLTSYPAQDGLCRLWTTFSADQIDLNYHNPAVLMQMLDVILYYVARGARYLRLDAVGYLWKEPGTTCIHLAQTHEIIRLLRLVLDSIAPGVKLITETNVPHNENVSYFGDGRSEAQLVYNFALAPLTLDAFRTGDATRLARWAEQDPLPSDRVTFLNFLASHDGIGLNPARGILSEAEIEALVAATLERGGRVSYKHNANGTTSPYELNINLFDALSTPPDAPEPVETQIERMLTAHAILCSLAGVPAIYFHSLFGSRGDPAGAERSGQPRRINRQKLARVALEGELSDATSIRARIYTGIARLLRIRRAHAAFHPHGEQEILHGDPRVLSFWRRSPDGRARVLCLHNLSSSTIEFAPAAKGHAWVDLIDESAVSPFHLRPYQTRWLVTG